MANKSSDKPRRTEPKVRSKKEIKIEKISKAEIKARQKAKDKAAKKALLKEKKSLKASENAKKMARDTSKKRAGQKNKIKYGLNMKREEAVNYFSAIISGLEKGSVQFRHAKEKVVLTPDDQVDVEITAQTRGKKEKVTFEISWQASATKDLFIAS